MKKILLTGLFTLLLFALRAQDIIFFKNGEEVTGTVLEVTPDEVRYEKAAYGPVYTELKSNIILIQYKDGSTDIFQKEVKRGKEGYLQGITDASTYRVKLLPCLGTGTTALVMTPLWGLVPAIACASSKPFIEPENLKNSLLYDNPEYMQGYIEIAHKKKKEKVWRAYGIGSAPWVLLILFVLL